MKTLFSILFFLFSFNAYSLELNLEAADCSWEPTRLAKSTITVQGRSGNFFLVKVTGGYPDFNVYHTQTCINTSFNGTPGEHGADGHTVSVEGHAIYEDPYLYLVLPGIQDGYLKEIFEVKYSFRFIKNPDNSFTLLQRDWIGIYQSEVKTETTNYESLKPAIRYQLNP